MCDLSFPRSPERCAFGSKHGLSCNEVECVMTRGLLNVWELDALNATELQRTRRLLAGVLGDRRIECNRASACKEAAC